MIDHSISKQCNSKKIQHSSNPVSTIPDCGLERSKLRIWLRVPVGPRLVSALALVYMRLDDGVISY